jgi:AcrR family transcriptional regulator
MSSVVAMRTPTLRDRQKAETRARVIEAARALFDERGFAEATIRDIAARAEVAPGSVFTTFASKAELLQEIIFNRYEELFATISDAVSRPGDVAARLGALGHAAYEMELKELRLLAENIGASWTWTPEADAENRRRLRPFLNIIIAVLKDGQIEGAIAPRADLTLIADTMFCCYLRDFRRAIYDGWTAAQCGDYFASQVRLILGGCRP